MANNKQKKQQTTKCTFDPAEREYYERRLEAGTLSVEEMMFLEESGFFEMLESEVVPTDSFTITGKALPPEQFNALVIKSLNGLTDKDEEYRLWQAIELLILKIAGAMFPSYIKISDARNSSALTNKEDLLQDIRMRVFEVFSKYDPSKGSFSLFIRPYILNAGCQRISGDMDPHAHKRLKALREQLEDIIAQYGGLPNIYKLQAMTSASPRDLEEVLNPVTIISGDQSIDPDASDEAPKNTLFDGIEGPTFENPVNQVMRREQQNAVWGALGMMDEMTQDIIMRTQAEGVPMKTVAADWGITVEKATKICQTGIRQFKQHPSVASYGGNKYFSLLGVFQAEGLTLAPSQVASDLADELAPEGADVLVLDDRELSEGNARVKANTKQNLKSKKIKNISQ